MDAEPLVCRVLPHAEADGARNMALDEALLESVAAEGRTAALRTYTWNPATLSLGYFQRLDEALADPRWREVPIVRRPSGGGAIWHDRELTYAVIVPRIHSLAHAPQDLYRAVHGAIVATFQQAHLSASMRGTGLAKKGNARPFLCFTDRDSEDIVMQGRKIVGSAQRRRSGAVLLHGSLLLQRSQHLPELEGLGDLAAIDPAALTWSVPLQESILRALALAARDSDVTPEEHQRAEVLAEAVYRSPAWTGRR